MAHTTFAMTSFFKKEMVPKGWTPGPSRQEGRPVQAALKFMPDSRDVSQGCHPQCPHRRLWSDKHKSVSDSPLTGSLGGELQS